MSDTDTRRALQITSAWLVMLAKRFNLDEATTRATIRYDGKIISDATLGEALDIANEALEPKASAQEGEAA